MQIARITGKCVRRLDGRISFLYRAVLSEWYEKVSVRAFSVFRYSYLSADIFSLLEFVIIFTYTRFFFIRYLLHTIICRQDNWSHFIYTYRRKLFLKHTQLLYVYRMIDFSLLIFIAYKYCSVIVMHIHVIILLIFWRYTYILIFGCYFKMKQKTIQRNRAGF